MFPIILRILLQLLLICGVIFMLMKQFRKIDLTEERRTQLEDSLTIINSTLELGYKLKQVDIDKLLKAKKNAEKLLDRVN